MHNFQKPENALKRAAELRAIGQSDEALTILHSAIGHKFFRIQGWDMVQEQIMLEYVALCIDQDKLRMARDGLHQYRLISQHANVASLGKVIVELLDRAENRLKKIKETVPEGEALKGGIVEDGIEYDESPEALMASTLQVEMRDPATKSLHDVYRFLWEIYKMILDIMRATPKLEKVYHETARKAITFCRENGRLVEFKRLCDVLRGHYAFLLKVQNKPEMECMLKPELHIETRINQLITACDMGMWKEAFNTVEDLYTLGIRDYITKTFQGSVSVLGQQKEKLLKWLAIFYEKLALIFWVSDLHLFHALAVLRYVMHIRMYKKKVSEEEICYLCSKCVLAVLAVPNYQKHSLKATEFSTSLATSTYEMQKRMSTLLGYNTIPTKESLHSSLALKNVLPLADPNVQKLYDLVENSNSMKMCVQMVPLLNKFEEKTSEYAEKLKSSSGLNGVGVTTLASIRKAGDETLHCYYPKIKSVVFHKMLVRLSKVYASMTIDFFTKSICPPGFYEWDYAEKEIAHLVYRGLVHIRFDHTNRVFHFNRSEVNSDTIASIRHQLTDLGKNLYYSMRLLSPADANKTSEQRRLQLVSMKNNIEKERTRLLKRTTEIYQRRQEHQVVQMRVEEERKKMEMQQKINEERAEKERREEALRQLELQRKKDEKYKIKSEIASQILMEVKKLCTQTSKVYVKGKTLEELTVDDLIDGVVNYEDLEKAHEEHLLRERQDCVKQRKAEVRRVDHFLRAVREADMELYPEYMEKLVKADTDLLMEVQKRREDKYKEDAEAMLKEKNLFKTVMEDKKDWVETQMVERRKDYEEMLEQQKERFKKMLVSEKIARARLRYQEDQLRKRQEEQMRLEEQRRQEELLRRKEEEEEQRRRQEEEQRKKKEQEEHRKKLDEIAEIQRQKQLEIERRLMASYEPNTQQRVKTTYKQEGYVKQETFGRQPREEPKEGMVRNASRDEKYVRTIREDSVENHNAKETITRELSREKLTRDGTRDGYTRNNIHREGESSEDWRNDVKKNGSKQFRGFSKKIVKKPSDDEGSWRR
ncbi:eukaryotic translation initiation factor 3 subunit 10 [Theileria orientalis]|uniref:Eukaryotic translation initiation factor 3 subunit A n=1 Tax=Theileria orientalis TaxID=68886 RepID=A0A976M3P0_THEOR|nr:eukaryotic translation initiation factor 3 subunit 10 [Theileria orientalis]